jgi:molybdenum cofactor biosynthesis enzyme MoaA
MEVSNIFWDRISERAEETKQALQEGRIPRIVRFAVHVTSACNMRCKYCREKKSDVFIDRELFKSICYRAGKDGVVHVTGGEPSLVPWLEEEIRNHRRLTRFAWNSNLLIMPRQETLKTIFRLKTSLDDYNSDRWNEVVGGDYFSSVVDHIKRCSSEVKHTSICYTATHQNSFRFDNFIRFCEREFPDLYSISVSFYKGNALSLILTDEDIGFLFECSDLLNTVSKKVFIETHKREGNYFPENMEIPCYLSLTERLYDEYGREFYCSHLYRDKVAPPGSPGKDVHCITGCNARFNKFNREIHEFVSAKKL